MRNWSKLLIGLCLFIISGLILDIEVNAAPGSAIESGVFADDINLSGLSSEDAMVAINSKVDGRRDAVVTLTDGADYSMSFSAADIDYAWSNKEIVPQAATLGKSGNIIKRYKALKDLSKENQVYELEYTINDQALLDIINSCAESYNQDAVNATMKREDGAFSITEGYIGREIDCVTTLNEIKEFIINDWDGEDVMLSFAVSEVAPKGLAQDLAMVGDILGEFTTSYTTSGASRSANIANACSLINGTTLFPGDEFSTLALITPFTAANGYYLAGSYANGQVVESFGGGICQVSTTLYNAVLLSELEVSERHNHSMIISYVKPSMDAAIAESADKDFKFVNNTDYPIYIEGTTEGKKINFKVYGVESRPASHSVAYESEVLETNVPETDAIYTDASQRAGYSSGIQSAHIGYKARLWKKTYENGELISKEEVNSSVYNKSPRSITIGVSTDNADVYNMLMAAAASGSADQAAAAAATAAAILGGAQQAPAPAVQPQAPAVQTYEPEPEPEPQYVPEPEYQEEILSFE